MVSVSNFEGKGKGLVISSFSSKGETIFTEVPLVSIQYSWNKKYGYLCCDFCMKPLEDITENLRRLTNEKSLVVPYTDDCIIAQTKAEFISCTGCNEHYCSYTCLNKAWNSYHKFLCLSSNNISHNFLEEFESVWNSIHYPPESTNLMIIIKIIAMLVQSDDRNALLNKFANFHQSTQEETNKLISKYLNVSVMKKLEVLYNLFKENMNIEMVNKSIYSFDRFISIVALICRNSFSIATNTFKLWKKSVEKKYGKTPEYEEFLYKINSQIERQVGIEFINNEGIGLFEKQSLINHSCDPNCDIEMNGLNSEISIVALRDIKEGEELTISYLEYIDLERSRHTRQSILKDYYLFDCQCDKCVSQINDPDVTSEDEDEEIEA